MSRKGIKARIATANPYVDDFGNSKDQLNFVFYPPSDFTDTDAGQILSAVGAVVRTQISASPCPESQEFASRKLRFIRSNGNSFSLPVYDRSQIKQIAQDVIDITPVNSLPIVCVELIGEKWIDVRDDLRTTASGQTQLPPIQPNTADGKNRFFYSGVMSGYERDSGAAFGDNDLIPFKMQTDIDDQPYSGMTTVITNCLGSVEIGGLSCGRRGRIVTPRMFVPSILTRPYITNPSPPPAEIPDDSGTDSLQTLTVPVADSNSTGSPSIVECGTALANIAAVICLRYEGESNNRYHKQLTLP